MKIYNYAVIDKVLPVEVNGEKLQLNICGSYCFYSKVDYYKVGDCLKIDLDSNKVFKV